MIEKIRKATKVVIGRSRRAKMSCPSASITWGAAAHSSAAIAPSASNTHRNHADPRWPGTDRQRVPPEMEEIEIGRCWQMIEQKGRIIGDRHHDEDRDQERHAQPPGTVGQEVCTSPVRQAVTNE